MKKYMGKIKKVFLRIITVYYIIFVDVIKIKDRYGK